MGAITRDKIVRTGAVVAVGTAFAAGAVAGQAFGSGRTTLACSVVGGIVHRVAPRACTIYYPNRVRNNVVELQHLRWRAWGSSRATATGLTHYGHDNGPADPIHIVAYRRAPNSLRPAGRILVHEASRH